MLSLWPAPVQWYMVPQAPAEEGEVWLYKASPTSFPKGFKFHRVSGRLVASSCRGARPPVSAPPVQAHTPAT